MMVWSADEVHLNGVDIHVGIGATASKVLGHCSYAEIDRSCRCDAFDWLRRVRHIVDTGEPRRSRHLQELRFVCNKDHHHDLYRYDAIRLYARHHSVLQHSVESAFRDGNQHVQQWHVPEQFQLVDELWFRRGFCR